MAEPSPPAAPQTADSEQPPIANGTPATTDVEMADSAPAQEVLKSTARTHLHHHTNPQKSTPNPSLQPTVQTAPATPAPQPVAPSAPALPATTASSRNSPHPTAQAPTQPIPHGSPTRVYLNQNVTPHLLEAMKHLATNEPEKPLKWLSEFLAMKSAEIEG